MIIFTLNFVGTRKHRRHNAKYTVLQILKNTSFLPLGYLDRFFCTHYRYQYCGKFRNQQYLKQCWLQNLLRQEQHHSVREELRHSSEEMLATCIQSLKQRWKSVLILGTLWKNNLHFVNHVSITCVHFIIIVIIVSEKKNRRDYYRIAPRMFIKCEKKSSCSASTEPQ